MVVMALAEGLDLSAASRIFRHHPTTIARWVERCGAHGVRLHTLWGVTFYNFIRVNMALEVQIRGSSKHRLRTPAMVAGLPRRPWSVSDFLLLPLPRRAWLSPCGSPDPAWVPEPTVPVGWEYPGSVTAAKLKFRL